MPIKGVASLQDIHSIEAESLPASLPASTYELIAQGMRIDPKAPALSFFLRVDQHRTPETWTYEELFARITQTANLFHGLGATKDTVIAYVLPNLPETHFVLWGAQAAGIVFGVNPLLEPKTMAELMNVAGVSVLVTLGPFPGTDLWAKIQAAAPQVPSLRHLVLVDLAEHVPGVPGSPVPISAPESVQVHDFHQLLRQQPGDRLVSGRRIAREDDSSYFCTGGTTGLPKIAMRQHGNEVANAWSAGQVLGADILPGKNLFCGLPLFHVNAVLVTGLLPFSLGAHVVLGTAQGYRGEGVIARFWEIVEQHRIHFFSGVPTLYASLLQVPVEGRDIGSLSFGLCGAAPMPVQVFRDFEARTGLRILEGYGLTEGTCVSSVNPSRGERRVGSIGLRLPWQDMTVAILDARGAYVRDAEPNEVGAIVLTGPNVFRGYMIPEQNRWVDIDGRRWFDTGDLGYRDAEGYFWLTGRQKELIIRGGHNIDPATIEEPLHRHPAVQIAAAVGRPDVHAGELPVAYVQLRPGASATGAEILEFLRGEISERAALPKAIHVIDAIPLTVVGKIFKPALRRREIADALSAALIQAGIEASSVEAIEDPARGTLVRAALRRADDTTEAARILGQFTLPFELVP
ncbi:acyl-CoA synthetase [Pendulispora rubella]|uniref:Acyl-CoA synthetase n=1 Tax=Pendulispora rubella TaxID=2741070 RepID=A0ABZ2KXA0_9BACT